MKKIHSLVLALLAVLLALPVPSLAASSAQEIGIVVMHGKGGRPSRLVDKLANSLSKEGFWVANLEMPWSFDRQYDVSLESAIAEVSSALAAMRAGGAKKLFVVGHSQGGIFALLYGGRHKLDGVTVIVPGGNVDAKVYREALGRHVARAQQMVAEGRGAEKAEFADYEGSRGVSGVNAAAATYLSWFDPNGAFTAAVFSRVLPPTPVLYVTANRDYPGLLRFRDKNFAALPPHALTRMAEVDSDHLNAPAAAVPEIIRWVREVAAQ